MLKRILFAILLAFSVLPMPSPAQVSYSPDFSDTSVFDPRLWGPKVIVADYQMAGNDRVLVLNCSIECTVTLPACHPGTVIRLLNASPVYISYVPGGNTSTYTSTAVVPGGADVWISGGSPTGAGVGSYTLSGLGPGTLKFGAVGYAAGNNGCAWASLK